MVAVQGRPACLHPHRQPEYMNKVLSQSCTDRKTAHFLQIQLLYLTFLLKKTIKDTSNSYYKTYSSPCLSSALQSCSPYFSWLDSCSRSPWVWPGLQVDVRKSLLSAAAGDLLQEHTAEMTDRLPSSSFSPFVSRQNLTYLLLGFFLYPPPILLSTVQCSME